jgi:Rrf2 family protein
MTLRLTRATDYAILAMMHLGSLPEGRIALRDEIARACDIPPSFLAKLLRQLVKAGLLRSTRGVNGGFGMQRRASEINLLDILEGIEGRIHLTDGAQGRPTSGVWPEVQRQMTSLLRGTTLETLLSARRVNRQADYRIGA